MKTLIILSSLVWVCLGGEFDTSSVKWVLVTIEHELTYETKRVLARCWWRSGDHWYVRLASGGEMWSDKPVVEVD